MGYAIAYPLMVGYAWVPGGCTDVRYLGASLEKHPNSHLNAEVEVSELMGAEIYLYLTYQGQNLMARVAPTSKSRRGDKIVVAMDTNKIHLFDPESEKTLLN